MSDLITLVGTAVGHDGGVPLPGVVVSATSSRRVTQTSAGEDALTDASVTSGEDGTFTLPLVYAPGLFYRVVYRVRGEWLYRGTLACDSYAPGATVDVKDLPPVVGVPPTAVEVLQAWLLARLGAIDLTHGGVTAIVALSQTDYDDLDPPDESTLYVITD